MINCQYRYRGTARYLKGVRVPTNDGEMPFLSLQKMWLAAQNSHSGPKRWVPRLCNADQNRINLAQKGDVTDVFNWVLACLRSRYWSLLSCPGVKVWLPVSGQENTGHTRVERDNRSTEQPRDMICATRHTQDITANTRAQDPYGSGPGITVPDPDQAENKRADT